MNITEAAARLLSNFSPEERSIPDAVTYPGRNAAVQAALNSALQDLFAKGKPWVRTDKRGAVINAPTTVTIAVTNGSTAGTITGWASWMAGCSIVIDGAAVDNEIRNASASVVLRYPYSGTTGTKTAIVYHDSITVGTDVLELHAEVKVDNRTVHLMTGSKAFASIGATEDFGFPQTVEDARIGVTVGLPIGYEVETWSADGTTAPVIRVRLYPAPAQAGFMSYSAMLLPPIVSDIASTDTLPIPYQFMESIFLPIATKKLRTCSFWRAATADQQIEDDYRNAILNLNESEPTMIQRPHFITRG